MLSSIINSIRGVSVGSNGQEGSDSSEDEQEIRIPQVQTGISTNSSTSAPHTEQLQTNGQPVTNGKEEADHIEKFAGTGIITSLDLSMTTGVISRMYQFDIEQFCDGSSNFQRGSKVEFRAQRTSNDPQWKVTCMKLEQNKIGEINKERCRFRNVVAIVKSIGEDCITVDAGKEKTNKSRPIKVPNTADLKVDFDWMPGDWMQLRLENLSDVDYGDDIPADMTTCKIMSVSPLHSKKIVGRVTKSRNNFLIDDSIYFTQEMCNFQFRSGATVSCTAIQSLQYIGDKPVSWRAINVEKAQFLHYNDPESLGNPEDAEEIDEVGKLAIDEYHILLNDKFGVRINPKTLKFRPQVIGTDTAKTLTLHNSSSMTFHLKKIHLNQDASVCQFKIRARQQVDEVDGDDLPLIAGEEIVFDVTCCPKMIGRTSEICAFDFGDFMIGSIFSVIGQSAEEGLLLATKSAESIPQFRKQVGDQDITRITQDLNRRRIRGSQTVRAPFFSQKRLPLNRIPSELFTITKDKDEKELRRRYPGALKLLRFEIYKQKFQVSLWFEEIENDLRRRQYDLHEVRLIRHNGSPVTFTFFAPGIQEYNPPVNTQDTIDAFDEENTTNAKFQGTIMRIADNEVTCTFGDAFNNQYTGIPMTIQFNLSRTSYKRCHFAVQTAVDYLGSDFLFPEVGFRVKPPRILVYEDDGQKSLDVKAQATNQQNGQADVMANGNAQTIFHRAGLLPVFTENNRSARTSNNEAAGRRALSLKSRFVSDTASAPSCSTAKLEWFNKSLNYEQKNAVRQILRGQARPLPYIIYGPPGTGKTVTLIEAVMQVNKLDKNSRILVCAPSNSAADIIAEYLANSNQYHPGDFLRLNGYLRSGQLMMNTIAPFCTDGEELGNVAMHRLIVATCMTAGQFFTLDLSAGHFTHVFIDEAGYCTEPETMIPSVLLALTKGGQLIMAGDPNQLGPVLMSDVSQNCHLNHSFLERLMFRTLYKRDEINFPKEKYNPLVLTKLVRNYRAHSTLLKLPSQMFYHDDLVSEASYEESYELCGDPIMKDIVKTEGVPLVFHGVQGQCTREKDSPSWCNKPEVIQVVQYVNILMGKGLSKDDIGIITPYRKQVEKIRQGLTMILGTDDLPKVASVEEFQGGERKVIIISTVRSMNAEKINPELLERLTFLYQPKRFNVAITRAKALMIVVGNPHVLEQNKYWGRLLRYAIELNAYKGCNLPISLNVDLRTQAQEKILKAQLESMENGNGDHETFGSETVQ